MKKCPYCAEDIQDAAVVCKHCGRDLKGGASQVQIVPRKSGLRWGCLTIFLLSLFFVGWCISLMRDSTTPSSGTSGTSSPPQITAEDMKRERKGTYNGHQYSAVEKGGQTAVLFSPALPRNDAVVIGAIRQVLTDLEGVDARRATVEPFGRFLRVRTAAGAYDVLLMKEDDGTVNGFTFTKRE